MTLDEKLKEIPRSPGVYLHKDAAGEILYIGKAKNLRNRVRSYFQAGRTGDFSYGIKTGELVIAELASLSQRGIRPHRVHKTAPGVFACRAGAKDFVGRRVVRFDLVKVGGHLLSEKVHDLLVKR